MKKNILYPFFAISILMASCKKNNDDTTPVNNNAVNATIVLSTGAVITINARGTKAQMGLSGPLGSPGFISGTNDANAAVYIDVYPSITGPGSFNYLNGFRCQYRENITSGSTPVYQNSSTTAGSIIITSASNNNLEGSFSAVCKLGTDSVIVNGTFKGNY